MAEQIRAPLINGIENGKHLFVINRERLIAWREGLTEECHWVFVLGEDSADAHAASVSFHSERLAEIR
jgi:hypothetical protein